MTEKDYSLLRPFDEAAAKRGEAICGTKEEGPLKFGAGPDREGDVAVFDRFNGILVLNSDLLRMAPLAWVEGKPVYKDDPLYHKETGKQYIVSGGDSALSFHNTEVMLSPTLFAWENPTPKPVKRWVNVYADKYGDLLHETKDAADAAVSRHRIDCIEIELPPLGK